MLTSGIDLPIYVTLKWIHKTNQLNDFNLWCTIHMTITSIVIINTNTIMGVHNKGIINNNNNNLLILIRRSPVTIPTIWTR